MTFEEMQLILQQVVVTQRETQDITQSIARGIQAMQDKALSDEPKREEEKAEHQEQMAFPKTYIPGTSQYVGFYSINKTPGCNPPTNASRALAM